MASVNIIFSRQRSVLPHFQPKFGAVVCIFIQFFFSSKIWCFCSYFHLVPSRQFHFTLVFKMSLSNMRVASLRVCELRVCESASLRVASLRFASLRVASLRVVSLRVASLRWGFIASKTLT